MPIIAASASAYSADRPVFVIFGSGGAGGHAPADAPPIRPPGAGTAFALRRARPGAIRSATLIYFSVFSSSRRKGFRWRESAGFIELEEMVEEHQEHIARLQAQLEDAHAKLGLAERVFAASTRGDVVNIQRGSARRRANAPRRWCCTGRNRGGPPQHLPL